MFSFGTTGWYRHGPCPMGKSLSNRLRLKRKIKQNCNPCPHQISLYLISTQMTWEILCLCKTCAQRLMAALFIITKSHKATKMSFKKWMNKLQYIQNMKRHGGNLNVCTKWKKSIWKGYLLYDSNYIIFWERWNSGDSKTVSGCQGWWEGEMSSQSQESFWAKWRELLCMILQWWIHVIKHLTRLKEYTTPSEL